MSRAAPLHKPLTTSSAASLASRELRKLPLPYHGEHARGRSIWKRYPEDIDGVKAWLDGKFRQRLAGAALSVIRNDTGSPMMACGIWRSRSAQKSATSRLTASGRHSPKPCRMRLRRAFDEALTAMAEHMRNRDGQGIPEGGGCCGGGSCGHRRPRGQKS